MPVKDGGEMGGANGQVRRRFRTISWKSSWGIFVEDTHLATIQGIQKSIPTSLRGLAGGRGIPGRIMGVEVTKDKAVIFLVKKLRKIGGITRRTGGNRRNVNIKNVSRRSVETYPDAVNFKDRISTEMREVKRSKINGMVDKED